MKKYVIEDGILKKIINKNKCIVLTEEIIKKLIIEIDKFIYI